MMSPWVQILSCRPWLSFGTAQLLVDALRARLRHSQPVPDVAGDPERLYYVDRCNDVWRLLLEGNMGNIPLLFRDAARNASLCRAPYSCAQRIANAVYAVRGAHLVWSDEILSLLHDDARRLAEMPEFLSCSNSFNNHLLNDYRALLLYAHHFSATPGAVNVDKAIFTVESLLERHLDRLFLADEGPVLNEGSVSYEILALARLFDIGMSGRESDLVGLFRSWLGGRAVAMVSIYRKDHCWLLPEIGDITPDWHSAAVVDFLDSVFLGASGIYRRIWENELPALGFPQERDTEDAYVTGGGTCAE